MSGKGSSSSARSGSSRKVSSTRRGTGKGSATRRQAPPTLTSRALRSSSKVLGNHADDVTGLLLAAAAVVCGLGIYAGGGGPVGRGLADLAGTALGWMRYLLPPALALGGASLIARKAPPEPAEGDDGPNTAAHVGVGAVLLVLAVAGLAHVLGGSPSFSGPDDELRSAGGWLGAAVGTPLEGGLGHGGAIAFLVLMAVGGLVVFTRTTLRDAADRTVAGVRPVTARINQRLATLFRLPYEGDPAPEPFTDEIDPSLVPDDPTLVEPSPAGADDATATGTAKGIRPPKRKAPRFEAPQSDAVEPEQLEIALGPAAKGSPWKLPPITLLERSGSQQVDRKMIEDTGRTLEKALADHGVETRLVGMVVGPHGHPLRARARPGREGQPGDEPAQGHRLRHGDARRAHPRPDPRQAGDRRRGPQRPPADRRPRRHPHQRGGPAGHPPARGRHRAATSTVVRS